MSLHPDFLRLPLAHRGLHEARRRRLENSRSAVAAAVAAGYGIEIDVQLSADGHAIVFHDATLDRLTAESGLAGTRPMTDLARIRLTGTDETIPPLGEILDLVAGKVPLLIEMKDPAGDLSSSGDDLAAAVGRDLDSYRGPVALMSFNPAFVAAAAEAAPGVPRGLTTDAFAPASWPDVPSHRLERLRAIEVEAAGAQFISHNWRDLGSPPVARVRTLGLPVLTWTIRSPTEEASAREGCDNITFEGYLPRLP